MYKVLHGKFFGEGRMRMGEFLNAARGGGFITMYVEKDGKIATFGNIIGHVVVIQKEKGSLRIPKELADILRNPYIIKVGREVYQSKIRLENNNDGIERGEPVIVKGVYDIRWAYPEIHKGQQKVVYTEEAVRLDNHRYPKDPANRQAYDTFRKPWGEISEEWKMSIIQESRLTAFLIMKTFQVMAQDREIPEDKDFLEFSRVLFSLFSSLDGHSAAKPQRWALATTAQWLKEDPYYSLPTNRPWSEPPVDVNMAVKAYRRNCGSLWFARFRSWNMTIHYDQACHSCDDKLSPAELATHDCRNKNGLYGDGLYCEYELCMGVDHTILTCNMVTAWCQYCERRGHLPVHHLTYELKKLENLYLAAEPFNLKTGLKLLTGGKKYAKQVKEAHWRCGLYASSCLEVPKYAKMQPCINVESDVETESSAETHVSTKARINKALYGLRKLYKDGHSRRGVPFNEEKMREIADQIRELERRKVAAVAAQTPPAAQSEKPKPARATPQKPMAERTSSKAAPSSTSHRPEVPPDTYQEYRDGKLREYKICQQHTPRRIPTPRPGSWRSSLHLPTKGE